MDSSYSVTRLSALKFITMVSVQNGIYSYNPTCVWMLWMNACWKVNFSLHSFYLHVSSMLRLWHMNMMIFICAKAFNVHRPWHVLCARCDCKEKKMCPDDELFSIFRFCPFSRFQFGMFRCTFYYFLFSYTIISYLFFSLFSWLFFSVLFFHSLSLYRASIARCDFSIRKKHLNIEVIKCFVCVK